jgi:hypothetical protein
MSTIATVLDFPTPMATPRLGTAVLPLVPSAPTTTPNPLVPMTRKQAREDRLLQYLEEERLDDERALASITVRYIPTLFLACALTRLSSPEPSYHPAHAV